jgi:putative ribosome biogenesis GTPase RsgA
MLHLLQILSDSSDFFVVGVLGQQGVGKSSLLNAVLGSDASNPTLPVTSLEQLLQAKHCTSAATVASQPQEHIVAIDTWPIHSASVLLDVLGMERIISTVGKAAAQASMGE